MEVSEIRNLVRDLDLTVQPRIVPRYKTWLPLATQQLRLRSLVQIIGHNITAHGNNEVCWLYYTLHRSSMSSPLYTSEMINNANPRWSSLEVPIIHATGYSTASEIILRLWKRTTVDDSPKDDTVFTWGVSFTGLVYVGPKLPSNLATVLKDNSLIFQFHGGFFAPSYCFANAPELKRYLHIKINTSEVKDSYTVNKLTSLRSKMQALKQQTESVEALRMRIASGESIQTPKFQQSSLNRLFPPRKVNREKKAEILRIRKELEMARFRTKLLEQERSRKTGELRTLNQLHSSIVEENSDHGSELMERYRELNKDKERLNEWRQSHAETRETYVQLSTQLALRRRQLISELSLIYPIAQESGGKFSINNVHLPDSEDLETSNDTQVAVALGFVAHTTQMIASFLNVPTRYPIIHYGSRSKIIDHITEHLPDNDRRFPLFARSKDKLQFRYGVYLLNKNIAQLRWYGGLPTADLRTTLSNLASLINIRPTQTHLDNSKRTFSTSSLDTDVGSNRHNAPLTPPIQKLIFEKCHRPSRSMSQLKSIKSTLGSSLDQGLDKPVQTPILGSQSKRICKSEESAIDNKALVLAKDRSTNSSNETLNSAIIGKLSRKNEEEAPVKSADIAVESNIEILIPASVSKRINATGGTEGPASVRDRSSNSISSCEMALSNSQNDCDESGNDHSVIRKEDIDEYMSSITEYEMTSKDATDSAVETEDRPSDRDLENEPVPGCDKLSTPVIEQNYNPQEEALTFQGLESSVTCTVLKSQATRTYEETDKQTITSSICGSSDECIPPTEVQLEVQQNVELKANEQQPEGAEQCRQSLIADPITMETDTSRGAHEQTEHYAFDEQSKPRDYQSSSEYIDIIRRSSENVYARTEALVNKKTSFKVMKPRL